MRDLLQTPDTFFVFLGPPLFFKDIVSTQKRVKAVFVQSPLKLLPMSKSEVVEALDKRLTLLQSPDVKKFIKPIDDNTIFELYDLYEGDIRSVMAALNDILDEQADRLSQPLTQAEALYLLGRERIRRLERSHEMTDARWRFLEKLYDEKRHVSQKELGRWLKTEQPNVSSYYLKPTH